MSDLYSGSSFISQPIQDELDGKVSLVSATTQSIGSGLDVGGNINLSAGSEFLIDGVPIGGGGSNLPTIDTLLVTGSIENFSQTDITYIIGCELSAHIALNNFYDFPAGKTKTIIAEELNGKIVLVLTDGGIALSPGLSKNGQQQTFLWDGTKWTYDDYKITTRLVGWGTTPLTPPNPNTTIQSELQESGDINLFTGKKYKINSVNLEAVAETLSNKTISGTSNTILNLPISSTTGLQTALDGKVALVSATKQTIGSALDVSGNINLPTGSQYQINGVSITAGGGGTPAGVEGSVQYNASGAFAGESDFNYSASTNTLTLTNGTLKPTKILFDNDKVIINGLTTGTPSAGIFTTAVGPQAGLTNQGTLATAIGKSAGETNQANYATAIGPGAGGDNQQPFAVAIGWSAGLLKQGASAIAIGNSAAGFYQGANSIAIGKQAGDNQAVNSICINATGLSLTNDTANTCVIAPVRNETDLTGLKSVYYNTTTKEMMTGVQSGGGGGGGTPGGVDGSVQYNASGAFAGESDFRYIASMKTLMLTDGTIETKQLKFDGINNINIGVRQNATDDGQRDDAIAIGTNSGLLNQSRKAIAIGLYAGVNYQQEDSIAIGSSSGDTQGYSTIAIGTRCGNNQRPYSIAIGYEAGGGVIGGFQSADCIAIGYRAGGTQQQGGSVAIGLNAGMDGQQQTAVAIGANAGNYSQRGNSIAIGNKAGANVQGRFNLEGNNIAIGYEAGNDNQAPHAIAIGYQAGKSYQAPNSICINATGIQLDNQTENSCVIKPIRNETNISGFLQLYYNPSTGELVYN